MGLARARPLSDSYAQITGASRRWPYDWSHLNSIAVEPDGSFLISARATWTVYDVDSQTGQIAWRRAAAGRASRWAPARPPRGSTTPSHSAPTATRCSTTAARHRPQADSRGQVVRIDPQTATASLVATVSTPTPTFAETQGDLQRLPDGDWWIGWGSVNQSSEIAPGGTLLYEAHTPAHSESYRSLRFAWSATPLTRPSVAVAARPRLRQLERSDRRRALAAARGSVTGPLRALGTVADDAFETALPLPASVRYVAVAALDARGRVLATSRPATAAGSAQRSSG